MCAGHSGGNGTQNHLIASFRLPRCWERRENGNPLTHAPMIVRLESCALRLRSVNSERGHSQGYLGQLRSRSRVDSAMAPLIWNGQSEKRQRAPNVGVIGAVDVESTKRALAGTIKPAGKKRTKTTGYNRLSQRLTRPVQSSLVTDYHC